MLQHEIDAFWRFALKPMALQVRVAVAQGLYRPQGYDRIQYGFGTLEAPKPEARTVTWDEWTNLKRPTRGAQTGS